MIKGTLAFVVVLLLALLGAAARRWLGHHRRNVPGLQSFATVLIGAALGGAGLRLFPDDLLLVLRPVVLLGLAWIGLLIGLQFDLRVLRGLEAWQRRSGFLIPLATGALTGLASIVTGLDPHVALLLAALATVASPRLIDQLSRSRPPADRAAMRLLLVVSSLSSAPAVVLFGVGSTTFMWSGEGFAPLASLTIGTGVAVILGYATILLLHGENEEIHVLALLVGVMALTAGAAALTGTEPMLMAAVSGAIIANRSRFPHRILRAAHAIETPMLTAILLLLGAWWRPSVPFLAATLLLVVVRGAAVLAGGRVLEWVAARHRVVIGVRLPGTGLMPQGPLALAFLVSSIQMGHGTASLAGGVFAALILNHLAGSIWTRRVLFGARTAARGESR